MSYNNYGLAVAPVVIPGDEKKEAMSMPPGNQQYYPNANANYGYPQQTGFMQPQQGYYPQQGNQGYYGAGTPAIGSPPNNGRNRSTLVVLGIGCVVVVVVGVILIIVAAVGGFDSCEFDLNTEIRVSENDHIGLVFSQCPSQATFAAFTNAAATWNAILTATDFDGFSLGLTSSVQELCGFLESDFDFGSGAILDHLVIIVEPIDIDGVNGILAQAGPCDAFTDSPLLPLVGGMQFDNADLEFLETEGILQDVITHEMAHVLGLGTIWGFVKQGGEVITQVADLDQALLQDPVFTFFTDGSFFANSSATPSFTGTAATAEFNSFQGTGTDVDVPVEDGRDFGGVQVFDIATGDGQGSIDGHWKITTFGNELMTFAIDEADAEHPLSSMTIQSLADLGYIVNAALADSYVLPGLGARESTNKVNKILRGSNGDGSGMVYLNGDIKRRFNVNDIVPLARATKP